MHRAYSLRRSRAPTAADLESPPAPRSSTKSRIFARGSLSHQLRRSTATIGAPDLSRKLQQLVKMEKNLMRSLELVGRERREVAQQVSLWGADCDDDVSDVTDKIGVLLYEVGELEDGFVDRYDQYRSTIKSIRDIERSVQPSRDRMRRLNDQIAQLTYKDPASPRLEVLRQELTRAEAESLVAEAQLSNVTRNKIKSAFAHQFDSMREHCERVAIIANFGKHLVDLIDDGAVTPGQARSAYDGQDASRAIIQDCEDALSRWVQRNAAVQPRLSTRSRTLSQRRKAGIRARSASTGLVAGLPQRQIEGVDLSTQDRAMSANNDEWEDESELVPMGAATAGGGADAREAAAAVGPTAGPSEEPHRQARRYSPDAVSDDEDDGDEHNHRIADHEHDHRSADHDAPAHPARLAASPSTED